MSQVLSTLTIPSRFCGPPRSGNGGYVSGLLAEQLGHTAAVTLRRVPPLDRELQVERVGAGGDEARLLDGSLLIAEARRCELQLEVPRGPSLARAEEWSRGYAGFLSHPFPTCFSCGPDRAAGDGLRIFPGRSPDESLVAAPWLPDASLAAADGALPSAVVWAALDCSGYFAAAHPDFALLGKMCAEITLPLTAAERYVVIGWKIAREGRKIFAGTAILDEQRAVRAKATQIWIATL